MGDKVRTFVDFWVQSHIRAEGYQAKRDTRLAKALVRKCVEMAQTERISASDIEAEFGDIIEYVHWQIKRVNDDLAISERDMDRANIRRIDQQLEEGLIDTFPASDPISKCDAAQQVQIRISLTAKLLNQKRHGRPTVVCQ